MSTSTEFFDIDKFDSNLIEYKPSASLTFNEAYQMYRLKKFLIN
jgi:hypothetical protein